MKHDLDIVQLGVEDYQPWGLGESHSVRKEEFLIERLSSASDTISWEIQKQGLKVADFDESCVDQFRSAQRWIELVPALRRVVQNAVSEIYLIQALPAYDVSHSEPRWPNKIFVSVPSKGEANGSLRLAESVVHETLHLVLSRFEEFRTLVAKPMARMRSPWRDEPRLVQGVLHGLYVFSNLYRIFKLLSHQQAGCETYITARMDDIRNEISAIDQIALLDGLTAAGRELALLWMNVDCERSEQAR